MHSNRFIIKEELSVSDTVVKITSQSLHPKGWSLSKGD